MTAYVINQKFHAVPLPVPMDREDCQRATAGAALPGEPSDRVLRTAEMFGIGLDETYEVTLYQDLSLDIRTGDVVFVTGPSGGGKSVLLARLAEAISRAHPGAQVLSLQAVTIPPDLCVIDGVPVGQRATPDPSGLPGGRPGGPAPYEAALRFLSVAGLSDAFLLLRRPSELSDGQRWRLRLAHALAALAPESRRAGSDEAPYPERVLVADELASTLDRLCARAIAYRLRRAATTHGLTVLAASAHEDIADDLAPDVLVIKHEAREVEVRYADPSRACRERDVAKAAMSRRRPPGRAASGPAPSEVEGSNDSILRSPDCIGTKDEPSRTEAER